MSKKVVGFVIFVVASVFIGVLVSNLVDNHSKEARYNDSRAQMIAEYNRQTETDAYKAEYNKMKQLKEMGLSGLDFYR